MNDGNKTKEQLRKELAEARRLIAELEKSANECKRAEEALKEQHARLDSIFRAAPTGIGVVANRILFEVNDHICEMTGYAREELVGKSSRILYPTQEDFDFVGSEKYRQIQAMGTGSVETRWRRKDGTIIDIILSSSTIIEGDISAGVTFTALDITDRKQVEEALRQSEAKYRFLTEKMNDIIGMMDLNLKIIYVSPSIEKISGFTPEECMQLNPTEMMTPESFAKAVDELSAELKLEQDEGVNTERTAKLELEYYHKNGSTVWMETVASFIRDDAGRITGIHGLSRDITDRKRMEEELKKHLDHLDDLVKKRTAELTKANEQLKKEIEDRKQAEDALRESEEKYRLHFSSSNDVMFSYDNQFRVLSVSPNAERLLGYKPKELVGRSFQDLNVLHPDYMDEAVDNALHVLSGETIYSSIYEFITKDGTRKFGEVSGVPFMKDGRVVGVISVARDISERIEKEKLLLESEGTAQALLNASIDLMVLLDTKGTILAMNKAASERLDKSVKELLGTCIFDHLPKDVVQRRKIYFEKVMSSGKPVRFKDERQGRLIYSSLYPVLNAHGKVTRIAVYGQDITEHKGRDIRD